jgi:DNA-binding NarL/FixJ family response regulator
LAAGVTGREREILAMIASGLSNKRIAVQLKRSVKTVEKHRANLMRKLQLHNVADVTRFAMQSGLLREEHAPD